MIEGRHLAEWTSRLVQIPSVTPRQVSPRAGIPGEAKIAEAVAGWFEALGGEVEVETVSEGRPNVYGIWRGHSDQWAAVDVHTDTVAVEQMLGDPFDGRIEDGRIYGRGAVDNKATLGMILALLEEMQRTGRKPGPNLLIAATVDEETGGSGAAACEAWVRHKGLALDQLLVAEPTLCAPAFGHKGGARVEFEVHGKTAHSAQAHLGQNAVTAAAHLIVAFEQEGNRFRTLPPETPVGVPTLTVTIVQGGLGFNVVPDRCRVVVDRRSVPGEQIDEIIVELERFATANCPLPVSIANAGGFRAFYQSPDSPWIQQLAEWSGHEAIPVPYGTNAWTYDGLAKETVVMGPGSIDQAHGEVEWIEIAEIEKMSQIYARWWEI
jgi:acetylornithine deacetylase/succinyl-diaminopimelate desuccinylase-like protein